MQTIIGANGGGAAAPEAVIKDTTTQDFMADVIEASKAQPVLVDFWAPWCGPCKQLTPILEKAVTAAAGAVRLVKMNIDEHPSIPGQMGIQSIPAVIAFVDGRPADGFMGAQTESQVAAFIEKIAGPVGPSDLETALAAAEQAAEAGDLNAAAQAYAGVLQQEADNVIAIAGLAKCYLGVDDVGRAKEILATLPADKADDPALSGVKAQLDLIEQTAHLGDPVELAERLASNSDDHAARFDLAMILHARGDLENAIKELVEIVRRDKSWEDDKARKQLLQFFEAWGPKDPMTLSGRRALSAVLFS